MSDRSTEQQPEPLRDPNAEDGPGQSDPNQTSGGPGRRRTGWWLAGGLGLILLLVAAVVAIPALLPPDNQVAQPSTPDRLPADPAPEGWRTEQFREITFQVPADWGYAYEPGSAWCGGSDGKTPRPEHRKPYVALGEPDAVPAIACPPLPDSLITEHVAAIQPADKKADGRYELGHGFWEVTRTVGAVKLRAVSKDADLAQRIVDTGAEAGADALCAPEHPLTTDPAARPDPAADVTSFGAVDRIALCQYSGGLKAAAQLSGAEAQGLIDGIAAAPVNADPACQNDPDPVGLDVMAVLRVQTAGEMREIILRQQGCPEGGDTVLGGFDDGSTVRASTPETCRAVLIKPLQIQAGSGAVMDRCRAG